ncbi:hypothetical protein [Micromonospora sp. DH14]|uniref:esterase/lipase family protein n=1 Tax=Micromonospora sp. DH14 TaxID=3040120 RepID=UPI0024413995|nr:hypothetical protein [Micromonospora sp. DH14]MDG9675909.1 hypothetical protein [Micromonospora sp. DH14]
MLKKMLALVATAALATVVGVVGTGAAAHAAPARDDSFNEPVYFVPGFTFDLLGRDPGHHCWEGYWKPMADAMRSWGWKGSYHTVSFYKGDNGCNTVIRENGDRDVSIYELGRLLAWNIYTSFSKNNISVDVVAHSMGGLIVRSALTGVAAKGSGWPPYLYIEDVVTIGTPHRGTNRASACAAIYGYRQCTEMSPGSALLNALYQSPQSAQGTDWTLIGSDDDDIISTESALGMTAGHYLRYDANQGLEHSNVHQVVSGNYYQRYKNYYEANWSQGWGAPPARSANNSLYYWWRW